MPSRRRTRARGKGKSESEESEAEASSEEITAVEENDDLEENSSDFINQPDEDDVDRGGEVIQSEDEAMKDESEEEIDGFVISSAKAPVSHARSSPRRPVRTVSKKVVSSSRKRPEPRSAKKQPPRSTRGKRVKVDQDTASSEAEEAEEALSEDSIRPSAFAKSSPTRSKPIGLPPPIFPSAPSAVSGAPRPRPFKRNAWHVYISYHVFWQQRQEIAVCFFRASACADGGMRRAT